jgi:hypothetical protein
MIQEVIIYVVIVGGSSYLTYSSVQPKMLFDWWLYFWAKNILTYKEVDWSELSDEECVEVAKVYKWIKPFGTCIKCFSFWFCLFPAYIFSFSMISFLFIFIASIIFSVWLVAMEY